jgi:transcriptional regulator with XRE-family HTH domain
MATDQGPVVQSALLRTELVRLRKENDLTQDQVARTLDWSTSKLIRVEGGKSGITRTDLQALLQHYGVTSEGRVARLQELARGAREPAWWNVYKGDAGDSYLNFVGYEAGASFIRQFHGSVVPGLLQTPEYAQVLTAGEVGPIDVGITVKLRMQRQRDLARRESPPRQFFIIDEAVIRRHVGINADPAIMPNQLRHIIDTIESNPLITVRVIPFTAGAHLGLFGPFTLLEFKGGLTDVLYLEGGRAPSLLLTGENPRVTEYQAAFEELLDTAQPVDQSIDLIKRVADELMA